MRVQFSVTALEKIKLESLAKNNGYPDIPTYCKDVSLNEKTYADLWNKVVCEIDSMPTGRNFALRDIVTTPPANLGVKLYENQAQLKIVVNEKKDSLKTNIFTKL